MSAPEKAQIRSPIPHLWQIAAGGDSDQLEDILSRGADVNASNPSGLTPLMVAAYHGRAEMVRALIKHGANVNATDEEGLTAAMLADDAGHDEVVKILVGGAVKRKRTAPAPETAQTQSAAEETFDTDADAGSLSPRMPGVRTLQEPPDIWDMVHETRSEFNAGSAFFGRLTRRHSLIGAAILLIVGGITGLCFMMLRRSAGNEAAVAPPPSNIRSADSRPTSNTNQPGRDQRSLSKAARTTSTLRSVFDLKHIVAGAAGMRDATALAPVAESRTTPGTRRTVALFHADDNKRVQKGKPHLGNSATAAAIEDRDRNQLLGSKSDNDKRANSPSGRKEAAKSPIAESNSPPKPNPTPKGKVIQWPQ